MRMAEGMRGHPRLPNAYSLTVSSKELDEGMVAEGFIPAFSLAPNQEDKRFGRSLWTLPHHVGTQRGQGLWLMQVNDSLTPRFGPNAFGMVRTVANGHAPTTILDIFQVEVEDLSWPESSLKHEEEHRLVAQAR